MKYNLKMTVTYSEVITILSIITCWKERSSTDHSHDAAPLSRDTNAV